MDRDISKIKSIRNANLERNIIRDKKQNHSLDLNDLNDLNKAAQARTECTARFIGQGGIKMKAYEVYAPEKRTYRDRISGVKVTQLTAYLGHSNHAYFTNNGWWDGGRRLLFCGDRQNASNLFSVEIESGEISRLTDFPAGSGVTPHFTNDVNPKRPEIYYTVGNKIYALDLLTLESRFLYEPQAGFNLHGGLVDADGKYTYAVLMEDLSDRVYANLSASYIGMEETFRADPDCRIIRIDTENGGAETLWQENLKNFQAGCYGNPQELETLLVYWQQQEKYHYPNARDMVERIRAIIEAQRQELEAQLAAKNAQLDEARTQALAATERAQGAEGYISYLNALKGGQGV